MRALNYTACQLCDHNKARDGKTVPPAVTKIADVRLCAGHLLALCSIAAENGVNLADEYLRSVA